MFSTPFHTFQGLNISVVTPCNPKSIEKKGLEISVAIPFHKVFLGSLRKGARPPKSTVAGKKRKMSTSLEEGVAQRMTELVQRVEHLEKENKKLLKRMKVME